MQDNFAGQAGTFYTDPETGTRRPIEALTKEPLTKETYVPEPALDPEPMQAAPKKLKKENINESI